MWGRRATRLSALLVCMFVASSPAPAHAQDRYSLAGGCYRVGTLPDAGPLRFQATDLGTYLLYTSDARFLTAHADGTTSREADPSADAVWRVGEGLTLNGKPATFTEADGCPVYPEVATDVAGAPSTGATSFGEVRGLLDAHMH